jgi:hypothetical protein
VLDLALLVSQGHQRGVEDRVQKWLAARRRGRRDTSASLVGHGRLGWEVM